MDNDKSRYMAPPIQVIEQHICSGLSHMHSRRVIQNDLKPANVFVSVQNGQYPHDFILCT